MGQSPAGKPPSVRTPEDRLDSWKEIAAYLKRDVTTVQRWEKREGMPVHRHLHDRSGSVYAFSSELDAWQQGRNLSLEPEERGQAAEAPVDGEGRERAKRTPYARRWLALAGMAALVVLILGYGLVRRHLGDAIQPKIKSLAVLPLKNLSADPTQDYLADGMTEALIGRLSGIHDLRVISRTSVMRFKDTKLSVPEIAKTLGVDALVEGSVIREGSRIRVHAQLIRAATDEHFWSEAYDRDLRDALTLESDVTQSIARKVEVTVTGEEHARFTATRPVSPDVYESYLKGRFALDKGDKAGATKCLQYFQDAIAKDPGYAPAYAGLSRCYQLAYDFGLVSDPEATSKGTAAVMKAVQLDEELSEAHAELGNYYFGLKWDYSAAEREYKRAIELDPNLSVGHSNYGFLLIDLGRTEEGLKEMLRARELDPLSLDIAENVGMRLLSSRRYDEAVAQFDSVIEMNPNYTLARWGLARTYELKGMYKEAISECLKIPALPNIDALTKAHFKRRCSLYEKIYAISGGDRFNRNWVQSARQEIQDSINRDNDAYFIATLYAETGENEKALDLLERAYAQHDSELLQLKVDPRMDNLRSNPRFQDLLRRMNFPES